MTTAQEQTARAIRATEERIKALGRSKLAHARHLGLSPSTVGSWFARRVISLTTLCHMANAVGRRPSVLLLSDEERGMLKDIVALLRVHGYTRLEKALTHYLEGTDASQDA